MFNFICGEVVAKEEGLLVIKSGEVGFELCVSDYTAIDYNVGDYAKVFAYLQVKEDGITLFGFSSLQEKELFLKVLSVQGVGPKLGIAILTGLSADEFALAVQTADVKRLSAVKGLGKKTAEKIILELHGKISAVEVINAGGEDLTKTAEPTAKLTAVEEDAVSALMGLGFTKTESVNAVKKARETGATSVEEIIMRALQGGL